MSTSRTRTWIVGSMASIGVVLGAAGIAGAATSGDSSAASTTAPAATVTVQGQSSTAGSTAATPQTPPADPATLTNGPGETLLTGDTASKVEAAAKAEIPDGTIIRVETDSDGAAYEAHVAKADGTQVTLKFDASFALTATEEGFGGGHGGKGGPGAPPAADGGAAAGTAAAA